MSLPPNASLPPHRQRQSTKNNMKDDDAGLSQSLSQLSLSGQLSGQRGPQSPGLSKLSTPLKPPSRHASPSPGRPPSRSPSSLGRDSRAGTPPLIRKASMNSLHSMNGIGPGRSASRRSSLGQVMSPSRPSFGNPPEPEKPLLTANTLAHSCFQAELEAHHGPSSDKLRTETVVILNDAVYGHRFSRPRTSRSALSTIVERPERIKASVLGVSTAYVRLGERHTDGAFPLHPKRNMQTLPSIPFRIHKTSRKLPLSSPAVTNVHGAKWMEELKVMCESAESILARGGKELQRPTMIRGPDHATPDKFHEGDLYLCAESLDAMEGALGAVCEAVDTVFSAGPRRAFVAVRPPGHHCSASHPSGFCWVNNVHVGIMHAILDHGLTHAAIIDFDLHHGDGSQAIAWAHNSRAAAASKNASAWKRASIGYFSLHDINSYPCEMGEEEKIKNASICIDNAHGQTVWNVHLQPWKSEKEFWEIYETKYAVLLERTRSYLKTQAQRLNDANQPPKAAIFLSAGFDASEWESAGMQRHQANVPTEFYARLTQDVIRLAAEEGLAVDGRVVSVLEGGYSDRALTSGILSHLCGLVSNQDLRNTRQDHGSLAFEMGHKTGALKTEAVSPVSPAMASLHPYDPSWWASCELEKLEHIVSCPDSPPKKPRQPASHTYSSPTQASTAKAVEHLKTRRSMSSLSMHGSKASSRPPSPPPPQVSWMIAAHELSKLLVPTDRQTDSCTHEDLNAEATRIRKDRQSSIIAQSDTAAGPDRPSSRMSLRERKPKTIDPIHEESSIQLSKNRRRTVATSVAPTEKAPSRTLASQPGVGQPLRRTARRLSGSSIEHSTPESVASCAPINEEEPSRAATLSSGRPSTALATRTQNAAKVIVKKPRTSTAPKEPISKSPRGSRLTTTAAPAASKPEVTADDMDKLTKGMRKIKINLITQSQKEAREKARLEAEKAASRSVTSPEAETPTSTSTHGASIDAPSQAVSPETSIPALTTTSESGLSTPVLEHNSSRTVSPDARHATPAGDETGDFVTYQSEGQAPVAIAQPESLRWPVNIPPLSPSAPKTSPDPVKKPSNLFQYGPSAIPFAPRAQGKEQQKAERTPSPKQRTFENKRETKSGSIWDVPTTPQK